MNYKHRTSIENYMSSKLLNLLIDEQNTKFIKSHPNNSCDWNSSCALLSSLPFSRDSLTANS